MTELTELEQEFLANSFIDELGYFDSEIDYFSEPKWRGVFGSLVKKDVLLLEEDRSYERQLYHDPIGWCDLYSISREFETFLDRNMITEDNYAVWSEL